MASAFPAGWAPPSCGCCSIAISAGQATLDDLAQMERLAAMVQRTSLCGLGQGAPNPIFSTLRYFRDEYLAHIVDRVCPGRGLRDRASGGPSMTVHTLRIDGADVAGHRRRSPSSPSRPRTASTSRRCATSTGFPTPARAGCVSSRSRVLRSSPRPAPPPSPKAWTSRRHPSSSPSTAGRSPRCCSSSATTSARSASPTTIASSRTSPRICGSTTSSCR